MSLVVRLAARSITHLLSQPATVGALAVVAGLASMSAIIGLRAHAGQEGRHEQLVQQLVIDQNRAGPAMGWQIEPALRVIRPLSPAAGLVQGVDGSTPAYWDFGPGGVTPAGVTPLHDADEISPNVDLEFVIRVLLGLFALVVSVSAIGLAGSGGDLVGLRSFPIPQHQVWLGQLFAAIGTVAVSWSLVTLSIALTTAVAGGTDATASALRATWQLTGPTLAYLAFMVSLGAVIATQVASAFQRGVVVVLVWLVFAGLLPTTLLSLARIMRPVSSHLVMATSRDAAYAAEIRSAELKMGDKIATYPEAQQPTTNPIPMEQYPEVSVMWDAQVREARRQARSIEGEWRAQEAAQDAWLRRIEWVSPASLFWRAATDATGTGVSDRAAWEAAVDEHWETLRQISFDDRPRAAVRIPADLGREVVAVHRHTVPTIRNLPQFDAGRVAALRTSRVVSSVAGLLAYSLVLAAVSGLIFLRK